MGKIVKYCASCDESFAEKFAFCPNCGKGMQAFEMNPLGEPIKAAEKTNVADANGDDVQLEIPAQTFTETKPSVEPAIVSETIAFSPAQKTQIISEKVETPPAIEAKPETIETPPTPVKKTKTFAAAATASNGGNYKSQTSNDGYRTVESQSYKRADNGFHVTVIEDQNVKQRNLLLLGSLLLMMSIATGGMIYSLFNHSFSIAAIGDESGLAMAIVDDVPMAVEEEAPKPKDNKDAGGGGGGGRDEQTPTSQGRLATQMEKPLLAPDKSFVQKDFELKYQAATQGKNNIKQTDQPYGDPNSKYTLSSNGMGSGGGQGSGIGTGQGSTLR